MKSFKPTKFGKDTTVEFVLDDDTVITQTIANLPIEDKDGVIFTEACKRYGEALERGLKINKIAPSTKVSEMKDKVQEIVKKDILKK